MSDSVSGPVSWPEALRFWARLGLISFGGPAGQISIMHRELVEQRRWISENRFLHALNYCMLLPGPEAQQLAVYIGWTLHGIRGGIAAGVLFVLPGAAVVLFLSILYAGYQEVTAVQALFFGIKAAVLAIVIEAVHRIGKRALKNVAMYSIAAIAFVAIFFFAVPFPLVVLGAGVAGLIGGRISPTNFVVIKGHEAETRTATAHTPVTATPASGQSMRARAIRIIVVCLLLWMLPIAMLAIFLGSNHVFVQEGVFFSKMAVVTFGGAYAVLAYVSQQAVEHYGWLAPGEMLDGLGLAETTPGPLILVVQFVGFLGAYRNPGTLDPMLAGTLGALLTTWVTFVPCFLWIFLGAPYIERLRSNRTLSAGLSAITAAVVGVVLNLAIWFALHVLFIEIETVHRFGMSLQVPHWATLDLASMLIAGTALFAMLKLRLPMLATLASCAALGIVYQFWVL
ncbi:MAG: chromate efflux transporter [Gammaproteobacteria bacterium]|nr:chromate efflux transporter [Gammaproteobacteria bacterium]MDH4315394.1 chromate efflux transporter [Gammaproteobacteria bacterium]MDH5214099.1 chromate efflux transporter [Gammaproteobacteria bacterium]